MGNISQNKIKILTGFLRSLGSVPDLYVVVKDFAGFLENYPELKKELEPFLAHNNAFCMRIKYEQKHWNTCFSSTMRLSAMCVKLKHAFFGECPFGICEYTVPILYENIAVGALCCGPFERKNGTAAMKLKRQAETLGLNYEQTVKDLKIKSLTEKPDLEQLGGYMTLAADYIADILREDNSKSFNSDMLRTRKNYIILSVSEYIRKYFWQDISLEILAENFRCSKSYISHEFKKETGFTIKEYLNKIRMAEAVTLLLNTDMAISEIALKAGYIDPDYFTTLFKKVYRQNPASYRKFKEK